MHWETEETKTYRAYQFELVFFLLFLYKEAAERPRGDRRGGEAAWSSSSVTEELPAAASTTS